MPGQNTLYIAEPIFSEKLLRFDKNASFPPIKKVGMTTDSPEQRQKDLLGTVSPAKVRIVKAWTNVDANDLEAFVHKMLDGLRLDGEYFWDEKESIVDSVSHYITKYHPEAVEIQLDEPADVIAAAYANSQSGETRISTLVLPRLSELGLKYSTTNNGTLANFRLGDDYKCKIGARTDDRFTFTIFSTTKSTAEALNDFPNSIEPSSNSIDESDRIARIPLTSLDKIFEAIDHALKTVN